MLYFRNIIALLNMFELADGDITGSNYNQAFQHLNETHPDLIQKLDLKTCNLNAFLSEVGFKNLSKMRSIYLSNDFAVLCCNTVLWA